VGGTNRIFRWILVEMEPRGCDVDTIPFIILIGVRPFGTLASFSLLYQSYMMVIVEQLVERRLAGEIEVLGEMYRRAAIRHCGNFSAVRDHTTVHISSN
jgi:hypothetical protein